jgi:hypothetical protein
VKARISIELTKQELRKCLEAAFEANPTTPGSDLESMPLTSQTDSIDPMVMMKQMFDLFGQMQESTTPRPPSSRSSYPSRPIRYNPSDPISTYDALLRFWPSNAIDISVKRLNGGAMTMLNHPVDSTTLYKAIMCFHGQHAETEYEIKFVNSGKYLGVARITLPDTCQQTAPQN